MARDALLYKTVATMGNMLRHHDDTVNKEALKKLLAQLDSRATHVYIDVASDRPYATATMYVMLEVGVNQIYFVRRRIGVHVVEFNKTVAKFYVTVTDMKGDVCNRFALSSDERK